MLPPILYYAGFSLLAGNGTDFFAVMRAVASTADSVYAQKLQSGPPHRLILDLFVLAPVAVGLAVAAMGSSLDGGGERAGGRFLSLLFIFATATFCVVPSRSVRFILLSDSLLRILAAWGLVNWSRQWSARWPRWTVAAVVAVICASAVVELYLFNETFLVWKVYDPVSDNVLHALKVIPFTPP